MERTHFISKILYAITRGLTWLYLVSTLYSLVSWITQTNVDITGKAIIIKYPFTDTRFLLLDNNASYLVFSFLLPILFYTLFFFLLSNVFKVFYQDRLFTAANIIHLKRFYAANLFLPVLLVIVATFFTKIENGVFLIILLHLFLGVFVFIISEIFKQGLHLQNEQDLYI